MKNGGKKDVLFFFLQRLTRDYSREINFSFTVWFSGEIIRKKSDYFVIYFEKLLQWIPSVF